MGLEEDFREVDEKGVGIDEVVVVEDTASSRGDAGGEDKPTLPETERGLDIQSKDAAESSKLEEEQEGPTI